LVMGSPGKVKRKMTAADIESVEMYSGRYAKYKEIYRAEAMERGENVDWSKYRG